MKAPELLQSNTSVAEKATSFVSSAQEACETILREKKNIVTQLQDQIADKETLLSVNTDLNKGVVSVTRESIKNIFSEILDLRYQLTIAQLQYDTYQKSFNYYFEEPKTK